MELQVRTSKIVRSEHYGHQVRIQYSKEVNQIDDIVGFPFISISDVFDLSHVSLVRYQDLRHTSFFCCYSLINKHIQGGCSNALRQLKTESQ